MRYQLIVRGEPGKYTRGDCVAIDLKGETLEEAREDALRQLYGPKDEWTSEWAFDTYRKRHYALGRFMGSHDPYYGQLLHPEGTDGEPVRSAWIVQVAEEIPLEGLRDEMQAFLDKEYARYAEDPEYKKYLELQKRFG